MKSTFEKMGGTYTLGADGIYYPNLVSTDEEPHYGKYGIMRKTSGPGGGCRCKCKFERSARC